MNDKKEMLFNMIIDLLKIYKGPNNEILEVEGELECQTDEVPSSSGWMEHIPNGYRTASIVIDYYNKDKRGRH